MTIVEMFGMTPVAFQALNVGIHVANIVIVFRILSLLKIEPFVKLCTLALFALHPINIESVAWISELKGLLGSFFVFASIVLYLRYLVQPTATWFIASMGAFCFSLMSKRIGVCLPLLLAFMDWRFTKEHKRMTGRDWGIGFILRMSPFCALAWLSMCQTLAGKMSTNNVEYSQLFWNSYGPCAAN